MSIKRPGDMIRLNTAFALQPRPLGESDLALVQQAMMQIAPDWSVELHGICADEITLVLLPEGGDDAMGPSFIISRENGCLRMDQVHWDRLTEVGLFASLIDVLDTLRLRLAFCMAGSAPASATLH